MEVVPWYFRLYLHTFKILCNKNTTRNGKFPRYLLMLYVTKYKSNLCLAVMFISLVLLNRRYIPGRDRSRPYLLELALRLPAKSSTTITIDFQRAFLKWTEHPPDAHHGFYIRFDINISLEYYPKYIHSNSSVALS